MIPCFRWNQHGTTRTMQRGNIPQSSTIALIVLATLFQLASSSVEAAPQKPSIIDLSYLHRTKSSLLGQAIEQALQAGGDENQIDIDVTASFIGKDIQDLLDALTKEDTRPHRKFGIIAQQNQWTTKEATLLLQAILGPEETVQDETAAKDQNENSPQKQRKRHRKDKHAAQVTTESVNVSGNETLPTPRDTDRANSDETTVTDASNTTTNLTTVELTGNATLESNVPSLSSDGIDMEGKASTLTAHSLVKLDLGWNYLGGNSDTSTGRSADKAWYHILQRLIRNHEKCPLQLSFSVCGLGPAACRAIGKGLIARYQTMLPPKMTIQDSIPAEDVHVPPPLCLSLVGNEGIGDPGVAALSAAIRTVTTKYPGCTVFERLDLSACGITDTGAEALAIALDQNPLCILHLDLSNNHITNEGAAALGRALGAGAGEHRSRVETLDLSNNPRIEDRGAKVLAGALEHGAIGSLVLRSCHVQADGAAALVKSIQKLTNSPLRPAEIRLDLSGNPLGILRKKPKSGGGKYSATALRSKATATTAAYMNMIGRTVQKSLKDLGITEASGPDTLESDDEEESQGQENGSNDDDPSKIKCGALAIADALLLEDDDDGEDDKVEGSASDIQSSCRVILGLRHCALDTRASEALAAVRHEMLSSPGKLDMIIDVRMNNVLEEETVAALGGNLSFESELNEMAERYLEGLEILRLARQRSREAVKTAKSRLKVEREMADAWGSAVPMGDELPMDYDVDQEETWDSDADYEREGDDGDEVDE